MSFNNPAGGGGDPEGLGFYRSLSGTHAIPGWDAYSFTINCGFVPESLSGTTQPSAWPTDKTQRSAVAWAAGIEPTWIVTANNPMRYLAPAPTFTVTGTQLIINTSAIGSSSSYTLYFTITGRAVE